MEKYKVIERSKGTGSTFSLLSKGMVPGIVYGKGTEPTKIALNYLFQKVSKNGIILIDDYNNVRGATKATNYFLKNRRGLKIQKLKFNKRLSYLVK